MNLLLDTHIIIWALTDDNRLTERDRNLILNPQNTIYYSIASLWEIAIKNYKYPDRCPYNEADISAHCKASGFLCLNITEKQIEAIRTLKVKEGANLLNLDPFDRMLLAQAKQEDLYLLSHDGNFSNYDEKCFVAV